MFNFRWHLLWAIAPTKNFKSAEAIIMGNIKIFVGIDINLEYYFATSLVLRIYFYYILHF